MCSNTKKKLAKVYYDTQSVFSCPDTIRDRMELYGPPLLLLFYYFQEPE